MNHMEMGNVWDTVAQGFTGVAEAMEQVGLGLKDFAANLEDWKEVFNLPLSSSRNMLPK